MWVKLILLLFCCALINTKSLVQRDSRHEILGENQHAKFLDAFKDIFHHVEIDDVDRLQGDNKLGASSQAQEKTKAEAKDEDEEEDEEEEEEDEQKEQKTLENKNDEDESEESSEEDDEGNTDEKKTDENTKDQKNDREDDSSEENDDDEDDDTINDVENKDKNENNLETEKSVEEDEESSGETNDEDTPTAQLSNAFLGSEMEFVETYKYPKESLDLQASAVQTPAADDKLADKVVNFFVLESFIKSFLPSKDSSPKQTEIDKASLIEEIEELERNNNVAEEQHAISNLPPRPVLDLDLDDEKTIGTFISQAVPKNLNQFQAKLQEVKDLWQKTSLNDLQAKLQQGIQDLWKKNNFNYLRAKFQQSVQGLWQENIKEHTQKSTHKDSKIGFGGWGDKPNKLLSGDATVYVNKAVQRAQAKLDEEGRTIYANNPPLTINVIPYTPITFKLKYVEGAHTLDTYGTSKAIYYNKLYAFTEYKFTELRYYYDVIISPYNLYNIRKSITVILNNAPAKMNLAMEKDNKMNILAFEFIKPEVMVECSSNRFVNYGFNYLINDVNPVIKQKLVEIVSRDSKLLLTDYLKDSQ